MTQQPIDYATPQPRQTRWGRGLMGWLLFVAVAALLFVWLKQQSPNVTAIDLSTFYAEIRAENVSRVIIDQDELSGSFRTPVPLGSVRITQFRTFLPEGAGGSWSFAQWLMDTSPRTSVRAERTNSLLTNFILPLIPWLLILAFIWFFVLRRLRPQPPGRPLPVVVVNSTPQ